MLRIDFLESGKGETIVLTFPEGSIGLVDAHPSTVGSRPGILDFLEKKKLAFVCLTHPHEDHGLDLVPILQRNDVGEFWHTVDDVTRFSQLIRQTPEFLSPMRESSAILRKGWAEFVINIFNAVASARIRPNQLRNDLQPLVVDGVQVTVGRPDNQASSKFLERYVERAKDAKKDLRDPNELSAVLILRYNDTTVLLGSDALKRAWKDVKSAIHKQGLPKPRVLKVPHHGASNSLHLHPNKNNVSYLDLCEDKCIAVLFAGDRSHPNVNVKAQLEERTGLESLYDISTVAAPLDPLGLGIHGGRCADDPARTVRYSRITVEITPAGAITVTRV